MVPLYGDKWGIRLVVNFHCCVEIKNGMDIHIHTLGVCATWLSLL